MSSPLKDVKAFASFPGRPQTLVLPRRTGPNYTSPEKERHPCAPLQLRFPLFVSGSGARVTTWAPQEVDYILGRGTPRTRSVQRPRLPRVLRLVPSEKALVFLWV